MLRNSRDIIRRLEQDGWLRVSVDGSHQTFKKAGVQHIITVPHPKKDLGKGLAGKIAKQANWR